MSYLLCPQDPSKDAGVRPKRPVLFLEFDLSVFNPVTPRELLVALGGAPASAAPTMLGSLP
jgi:hypothetical protein